MASVLFFDKQSVCEAYESRGIDTWSISEAKSLLIAGQGAESLEKALSMLSRNNTLATYTLRVYNCDIEPDDITNKTECNGEFKFKLSGSQPVGGVAHVGNDPASMLTSKLNGIVSDKIGKMIEKILSGEADEPPKPTVGEFVMGFIEDNPNVVLQVMDKLSGILRGGAAITAPIYQMQQPAAVAGVRPHAVGAVAEMLPDVLQRVANAIDRLQKCDPEICLHLEQLASLAETKPEMYKMALSFLK